MARTRDLAALSAILLAPIAALLLAQPPAVEAVAPAPAPPSPAAPVVAPAPAATPAPTADPVAPEPPAVAPEPPAPAPTRDPNQAMLVYKNALVLRTAADPNGSSGKISTVAEPGYLRATRPVLWDRLVQPVRALEAARVVVYDSDGSSCVAAVGAARLQLERSGDIFPLTESEDAWGGFEPPADKAVLRTVVQDTFNSADDLLLLAAQRGEDGRACQGEWARRADLPAPIVFGRRKLAGREAAAVATAALAVVRDQPEFAALQAEYSEYARSMSDGARDDWPDWDSFVAANLSATRWDEVGGPRRIVSVELRRTLEACSGEFAGSFAVLLEQQGEHMVRLAQPAWFDLTALMDTDRDGVLEAVTRSGHDRHALEAEGANADAVRDSFWISYVGCPC